MRNPVRNGLPREPKGLAQLLAVLLAVLAVLLTELAPVTVGATVSTSGAQGPVGPGSTGSGNGPSLAFLAQDSWLGPRGSFKLQVRTVTPESGFTLVGRLYPAVETMASVLNPADADLGRSLGRFTHAAVEAGTQTHAMQIPVVARDDGSDEPFVLPAGVFPVELQLRDPQGDVAARLVTYLAHLSEDQIARAAVGDGRPVGLLVDVRMTARRSTDGRARPDEEATRRLDQQLEALIAFGDVPVSLQLNPETVSALIETRAGVGGGALASLLTLTAANGRFATEVLPGTFVAFDEAAWLAAQNRDVLQAELDAGRATLRGAGIRAPTGLAVLEAPADEALLARYFDLGIDRVIAAQPPGGAALQVGPAPRLVVELPQQVTLPPADTALSPADGTATLGALDAYRLAAALLVDPAAGDKAGAHLRLGPELSLSGPFAAALLRILAEGGPLRASTIDGLFERDQHYSQAASWAAPAVAPTPASLSRGRLLADVSAQVSGLRSMIEDEALLGQFEARLLLVPARDLEDNVAQGLVAAVADAITNITGTVLVPGPQTFTVTSHRTSLPLVIRNEGDRQVQISLRLASGELEFTGNNPQTLVLEPGPNDLEIPIRTRRSGEFDFVIEVISPDASLTLGSIDVRVQSRAVSGVGVLLSGGALLFLFIWWVRNARRRRRHKLATEAAADPGPVPDTRSPEDPAPDNAALTESPPISTAVRPDTAVSPNG